MIESTSSRVGNTQLSIDQLGFGCASLGNLYRPITDQEATSVLNAARENGFRYFDTAPHYGQGLSERRVGDHLRTWEGHNYVLSTKVGRLLKPAEYKQIRHGFCSPMPFDIHYDYSYDGVMRSFEDSLQRMGINRVDILYMHDIGQLTHGQAHEELFKQAMSGGYRAMAELRSQGLVSAIGLGVNEFEVCELALQYGDWDCFLLAGRYTLLDQSSLVTFLPKCEQRNCSVIIGGAYNSGILATGTYGTQVPHYDYAPATPDIILRTRKLEALCKEYEVSLPAAALQFPLGHPAVVSVIPGIGTEKRVHQTKELMTSKIPTEFWQALKSGRLVHEATPVPWSNT